MSTKTLGFGMVVWSGAIASQVLFGAWRTGWAAPTPTSCLTAGIATLLVIMNLRQPTGPRRVASGARREATSRP